MPDLSASVVVGQLVGVLREAFEGPAQGWGYFTDQGPEAGLLGTLERLSAADASRPVGGSSVAAHAQHVAFGLAVSSAWIRGDNTPQDWTQSWAVRAVDEAGWDGLREKLRAGFRDLLGVVEAHGCDRPEAFGAAVAAIAHVAYHLGAVKQKAACLRQDRA
jgi:hypothetical protein